MIGIRPLLGLALLVLAVESVESEAVARADEIPLDVHEWKIIPRESGDVNYYKVIDVPDMPYIHGAYEPGMDTAVLGHEAPAGVKATKLRWTWRALELPKGANECGHGAADSAANVYVLWKRGLKYYTLKYVWSTSAKKGDVCDVRRSPFVSQDLVIQESGPPVGVWKTEELDLDAEFRKHFADGDAKAEVPELKGFGIMSDGDQSNSESWADYARFIVVTNGVTNSVTKGK